MAALNRQITRDQRDLLFREARYELEEQLHFETGRAELLAATARVRDFVRLFDDLGWHEEADWRESYALTMPDEQLERIIGRLRQAAQNLLHDATKGPFAPDHPANVDQDLEFLHVCCAIGGEG